MLRAGWAAALVIVLAGAPGARAFGPGDADAMFAAYNNAFYFTRDGKGFYRAPTNGAPWFWQRAEEMEMVLDTYERTTNAACLTLFSNLFNGFVGDYGTNWQWNEFNDDIMWMVIAGARAQKLSGNAVYGELAKANFDLCYARAWSADLGGGLWWKTSKQSKNACVNGPAAIAACMLYQAGGGATYLSKATNIYAWERARLFNPERGVVYDNIDLQGRVSRQRFSYNQGTFIGAANFLGRVDDAKAAANFTKDVLCKDGLLPNYGPTGDGSGFNGICARWVARFMKDRALQGAYLKWLQANADAAWSARRGHDGLSWQCWSQPTPGGTLNSWACCSAVVILQVVPAN